MKIIHKIKKIGKSNNATELYRYLKVSIIALTFDYSSYWLLFTYTSLAQEWLGILSYLSGLFLAYFLLKKYVFKSTWLKKRRLQEISLFIISGMIGSLVTYLTILIYKILLNSENHLAKIIASVISFFVVYFFRKFYVFKKSF
jgi:putative flippase GtrA